MANDLYNVLTWNQACIEFEEHILPALIEQERDSQGGEWKWADGPLRRESWNNWTDSLCKDEQISDWQYDNWSHPDWLETMQPCA